MKTYQPDSIQRITYFGIVFCTLAMGCQGKYIDDPNFSESDANSTLTVTGSTTDVPQTTSEPGSTSSTSLIPTDPTPFCGDGMVDEGEECDKGSGNSNQGSCTEMCKNAFCGDGYVSASETCDDGSENGGPSSRCSGECDAWCGDGNRQGDEECDDGNDEDNDRCFNDCTEASCGDGIISSKVEDCEGPPKFGCYECKDAMRVFITEGTYAGGFLGEDLGYKAGITTLDVADNLCNSLAGSFNESDDSAQFKAWVHYSHPWAEEIPAPVERFSFKEGPYILLSGDLVTEVTTDVNAFIDSEVPLARGINVTEESNVLDSDSVKKVWTAVLPDGSAANGQKDCFEWSGGMHSYGWYGVADQTGQSWTWDETQVATCDQEFRFYCFEQASDENGGGFFDVPSLR